MAERPKLKEFYKELYIFHCRFGGMKNTTENWQDCYNAALAIADKFGNSDFTTKLLAYTIEQIEREVKQ